LASGQRDRSKSRSGLALTGLVEFWATWCAPCLTELAHVRECFEKYHPRGFEVVGISLDEDRAALERYLKQQPFPWATLYDAGANNPLAAYYGVTGASAAILVDQEGRVVSINARGGELDYQLATLLGAAEAGGQAKQPAGSGQK
jgi:peroxiredoxin